MDEPVTVVSIPLESFITNLTVLGCTSPRSVSSKVNFTPLSSAIVKDSFNL